MEMIYYLVNTLFLLGKTKQFLPNQKGEIKGDKNGRWEKYFPILSMLYIDGRQKWILYKEAIISKPSF